MGQRLQAVRTGRGLPKRELARLVELKAPSLPKSKNGGQSGVDTIERIAKALECRPAGSPMASGRWCSHPQADTLDTCDGISLTAVFRFRFSKLSASWTVETGE